MTRRKRRGRRAPDSPPAYDAAIDRVIARLPELAALAVHRAARRAGRAAPPGPGSTGPRPARGDDMAPDPESARLPAPPPRAQAHPPVCVWEDDAVFRHTFLELLRPEQAAAVRAFGEVQFAMALEYTGKARSPDDSMAAWLRAVAADLRFLQGYLDCACDLEEGQDDDQEDDADDGEEDPGEGGPPGPSPLQVRRSRFGIRLAVRLGVLAGEIEAELEAGRREENG